MPLLPPRLPQSASPATTFPSIPVSTCAHFITLICFSNSSLFCLRLVAQSFQLPLNLIVTRVDFRSYCTTASYNFIYHKITNLAKSATFNLGGNAVVTYSNQMNACIFKDIFQRCITVQYITIHCSTLQYTKLWNNTLQYNKLQDTTIHSSTIHYNAL